MTSLTLSDLDIVGFASIIETPTLPRVLAPVFQKRQEPDFVVLPPFSLVADEVFNFKESNQAGLAALVSQEKITRLSEPIPAHSNYDLWVNPHGNVAYARKWEVKKAFKEIFESSMALAKTELNARRYTAASQHAAVARAVNPIHIDPLVIRGAAERLLGQLQQFALTRHLASDLISPQEFDSLVWDRTGDETAFERHGSAVMQCMTIRRSRF